MSNSLWPHESQHARPPCPSPIPGVYPNPCPLSRWCHPAISSSVVPFSSCPQYLPASGSFPVSQLFAWGGQSIGVSASASVLPMNTQDWCPLGWTGWISLQSKGLSLSPRESSPTPQFKSINSLVLSFLHSPTLTSIHDHWKNHSLHQTDLCWQSNVSASNQPLLQGKYPQQGPGSTYTRCFRPWDLCHKYLNSVLYIKQSHRQNVNKWT